MSILYSQLYFLNHFLNISKTFSFYLKKKKKISFIYIYMINFNYIYKF